MTAFGRSRVGVVEIGVSTTERIISPLAVIKQSEGILFMEVCYRLEP